MKLYNDFTYYSHSHFENAKNIGWVDLTEHVNPEKADSLLFDKLKKYLKYRLNTLRDINEIKDVTIDGNQYTLGYAEIRVLEKSGNIKFAAPDMMYYNILFHNYIPPQEFVDAVMNGIDPESMEYKEYLNRYKPEYQWGESNEYIIQSEKIHDLIKNNDTKGLFHEIEFNNKILEIVTTKGSVVNTALNYKQENLALGLLKYRFDINLFSGLELLTAIEFGMNSVVENLLEKNVNIRTTELHENPLCIAIMKNNFSAVKLLIDKTGSSLFKIYSNPFVRNMTMLELAKRYHNSEEMIRFIEYYS